jgi:hypothetical protein
MSEQMLGIEIRDWMCLGYVWRGCGEDAERVRGEQRGRNKHACIPVLVKPNDDVSQHLNHMLTDRA